MRGSKWLAAVVAVGSISTGVAVAGSGWGSETTGVSGTFEADLVAPPKERQCDSKHVKSRASWKGTQTSTDDRLTGRLKVDAESVVNTKTGWGYTTGSVEVRKSGRHGTKFRGEFIGVIEPDGGAEGFITGKTQGGHKSVRLLANFNVEQDQDTGAITGEFGQDSQLDSPYSMEDQDPAVLTNACFDHGHGGHGGH